MSLIPNLDRIDAALAFARRFGRNARGVAAVEFGLIVPLLLLMLVGTVEVSRAVAMDRRFDLLTTMVADLVAREEKMTADDLKAIYKIVDQVMSPYDASSLKISVIPVMASSNDASNTKVYAGTTNRPSHNDGPLPAKCAAYSLTPSLIAKGASVIVVETSYRFQPIFLNYVLKAKDWSDTAYAIPRRSCVAFDGDKCLTTCF